MILLSRCLNVNVLLSSLISPFMIFAVFDVFAVTRRLRMYKLQFLHSYLQFYYSRKIFKI